MKLGVNPLPLIERHLAPLPEDQPLSLYFRAGAERCRNLPAAQNASKAKETATTKIASKEAEKNVSCPVVGAAEQTAVL